MRLTLILVFTLLFITLGRAQVDSIFREPQPITAATASSRYISVDMNNPEEVDLALRRIHLFRYLETLVLEGEADTKDLRKMFYRVSSLKNLNALILRDNDLKEVPENIAVIKLLRSLTVTGSTALQYDKLFQYLKSVKLTELHLIDNDLKKIPPSISEIKTLTKVQLSGSLQMDYIDFVERLATLPNLTTLAIPLNYITEVPRNIDLLVNLQVMDVSNNSLSELPSEMSALKTINNLSVYGNLLLDPAKDLQQLKGNNIKYLALDKEISGEDLEQIKKVFPLAMVEFPISKEPTIEKSHEEKEPAYNGEVKVKKEARILSAAYLSYPSLFQGLAYNFDTLTFSQRFNDLRYVNVFQTAPTRRTRVAGEFYLYHRSDGYTRGDKKEICFYIPLYYKQISLNYPELRAFSGTYWVYRGSLSKKEFQRKYIYKKEKRKLWFPKKVWIAWNDIRVDFDKNNSQFQIILKTDTGFHQFMAFPMIYATPREKVIEGYNRRVLLYKKALQRRADRYNRKLARDRNAYDAAFRVAEDFAWRVLQRLMSNEEKLMNRKQWLEYYDALVADEMSALDKSKPAMTFVNRAFAVRGYTNIPVVNANFGSNGTDYGNKQVNIDFIDKDGGGKLAVKTILIVDNKKKSVTQTNGTLGLAPVTLNVQQFISCTMLVELRNGNIGVVVSDEIDSYHLERNKTYALRTIVFDRNLNTIGDFLGTALK